jgi:hypothetical protein
MKPRTVEATWEVPGPQKIIATKTHDDRRYVRLQGTDYAPAQIRTIAETLLSAADWVEALQNSLDNHEVKA